MTPLDVQAMRERHHKSHWRAWCAYDGQSWPCDAIQALDALGEAREELDRAKTFLEREGYRRCDTAACNCDSWHRGVDHRVSVLEAKLAAVEGIAPWAREARTLMGLHHSAFNHDYVRDERACVWCAVLARAPKDQMAEADRKARDDEELVRAAKKAVDEATVECAAALRRIAEAERERDERVPLAEWRRMMEGEAQIAAKAREYAAKVAALEADLAATQKALKQFEWFPHYVDGPNGREQSGAFCRACAMWMDEGHSDTCWLAAALASSPGAAKGAK